MVNGEWEDALQKTNGGISLAAGENEITRKMSLIVSCKSRVHLSRCRRAIKDKQDTKMNEQNIL